MDKKKTILILGMFAIIFMFFGGTLAYWQWQTSTEQQTNIVFTVTKDFECAADGGGNITSTDIELVPTDCLNTTYAIKREIIVTPTLYKSDLAISMDLWLDVNTIGEGLSASYNFRYALTKSNSSCINDAIAVGNFKGTTAESTVSLFNSKIYTSSTTEKYYLYIWLDSEETSQDTMNQTFDLSINGSCTNAPTIEPEAPTYYSTDSSDNNVLIPVTIANDGKVTVGNNYNYENKEWANAVVVDSTKVTTYIEKDGTEIPQEDILAYYVWIPRFKYKLWTSGSSALNDHRTIDIIWEKQDDEMSTSTTIGEYRTHPAFWWDGNADGVVDEDEMRSGIWVGKFEMSADPSDVCYTSPNSTNCGNSRVRSILPRILPNVNSVMYQNLNTQYIMGINVSSNLGINANWASRMMKNSEWGAVAYLSHSKYGINGPVGAASSSKTGCNGTECATEYGSATEYPQSTTGNITGIFDMAGGKNESVMVMIKFGNWTYVGTSLSKFNGFTGYIKSGIGGMSSVSGTSWPPAPNYDLYTVKMNSYAASGAMSYYNTQVSGLTACDGGVCYGHAWNETKNWYNGTTLFFSLSIRDVSGMTGVASYPAPSNTECITRGTNDNIFSMEATGCKGDSSTSESTNTWRSVLTERN